MRTLLNRLGSIRITIVVLLLLAGTSAIGTFLPRGADLGVWEKMTGTSVARIAVTLGLDDFYHSPWFAAILGVLALNLTACMLNRVSSMRWALAGGAALNRGPALQMPDTAKNRTRTEDALRSTGFSKRDNGKALVYNRGSSGYLFTLLSHSALLMIMAFSLYGSASGFIATQRVYVGDSTGTAYFWNFGEERPLPFEIRVDDFLIVPNPIGLRLGVLEVKTGKKGGLITTHTAGEFSLPGTGLKLELERFDADTGDFTVSWKDPGGRRRQAGREEEIGSTGLALVPVAFASWPERQAVAKVSLLDPERASTSGQISVNHPMVVRRVRIFLTDYGRDRHGLPYVGFQFVDDPGQWGVWTGSALFLVCVTGTLFTRHSSAVVIREGGLLKVHISSRGDRGEVVETVAERLKENGDEQGV